MTEAIGHTVLRVSSYHCNLNPIELVWSQVKGFVAWNSKTFKLVDVKVLLENGVTEKGNINPPTSWIVIQAGPASLVWLKKRQTNDGRLSDSEGGSKFTSTANESGFQQFVHYIRQQISNWIEHHAVTISVPNNTSGPRIVLQDGDRIIEADEPTYNASTLKGKSHRKKKWAVMIPLIALTKFLMLKALLVPIFVATMIIKKIALLGLFYLPPWFASLKICKKEPLVHYHHKSAYDHDEYAAGEYDSTAYQYTGYDRDWSRHHRRSYHPGL
ncbi:osiris 1 [Lycorma delicatula]|uniref:osiris 1 n=1 Tax=Lycorma delicatula TaxID=130591 RepID=UPI003F513752